MDKIDIRDLILRTLKENSVQENSSSLKRIVDENDFLGIAESVVKNLPIYVVMQQRELLINYNNYLYAEYFGADFDDSDVDVFLDQMGN